MIFVLSLRPHTAGEQRDHDVTAAHNLAKVFVGVRIPVIAPLLGRFL